MIWRFFEFNLTVFNLFYQFFSFRNTLGPCSAIPVVNLNAWKDNSYAGPKSSGSIVWCIFKLLNLSLLKIKKHHLNKRLAYLFFIQRCGNRSPYPSFSHYPRTTCIRTVKYFYSFVYRIFWEYFSASHCHWHWHCLSIIHEIEFTKRTCMLIFVYLCLDISCIQKAKYRLTIVANDVYMRCGKWLTHEIIRITL